MRRSYLAGALLLAPLTASVQAQEPGLRELVCRGGTSGFSFRVIADPSPQYPDRPKQVRVALGYRLSPAFNPEQLGTLLEGSCAWDSRFGAPTPQGTVVFDLPADAQESRVAEGLPRDVSLKAAVVYPDTASIRRYLTDPTQFWVFYVPDRGDPLSISYGPMDVDPAVLAALLAGSSAQPPAAPAPAPSPAPASPPPKTGRTGNKRAPAAGGGARTDPTTGTKAGAATTTSIARAPLTLVDVKRAMDKFTITFTARPNATPSVLYSTAEPVYEPISGRWFFAKGVLQGSGAVVGGFQAVVSSGTSSGIKAQYTATNRLPPQRGVLYHFIVTVPKSPNSPEEQITGQLTTMRQDVRVVITSVDYLKSNVEGLRHNFVVFPADSIAGGLEGIDNAPDRIRLLVWAYTTKNTLPPDDPNWNSVPGARSGLAKREFDLRTVPDSRPTLNFTLRSLEGDVVFEAYGYLKVTRY